MHRPRSGCPSIARCESTAWNMNVSLEELAEIARLAPTVLAFFSLV
jgi:hypothetical protein